jgi:type VI protein secretion system component VasF
MKISAWCSGVAWLALLTVAVAMETAAQPDSPAATVAIQRSLQAARIERHRNAILDAEHLQFLAAQLRDELAKSSPESISATAIKRSQEIEKLSRKIRSESEQ